MYRLGKFTGKIYTEEDFNTHKINECCLLITEDQSKNEQFIKDTYDRLYKECDGCKGCPESRKVVH